MHQSSFSSIPSEHLLLLLWLIFFYSSSILLLFWFTFSWWSMMMNVFSNANEPPVCLSSLFTFLSGIVVYSSIKIIVLFFLSAAMLVASVLQSLYYCFKISSHLTLNSSVSNSLNISGFFFPQGLLIFFLFLNTSQMSEIVQYFSSAYVIY